MKGATIRAKRLKDTHPSSPHSVHSQSPPSSSSSPALPPRKTKTTQSKPSLRAYSPSRCSAASPGRSLSQPSQPKTDPTANIPTAVMFIAVPVSLAFLGILGSFEALSATFLPPSAELFALITVAGGAVTVFFSAVVVADS